MFKGSKDNYRPVGILPIISKIFEKLLCKQITFFIYALLSNFQCGFRKEFGAQDCLLAMLDILFGVPQGLILGPILSNIFISDLFLVVKDVNFASYADDNTVYQSGKTVDNVINVYKYLQKNFSSGFLIIK